MIEGGCLCGAVRYRLSGVPSSSVVCHCESCRRASGAAAMAWITVGLAQFQVLSGEPAIYHSSPHVTRQFCGRCGTGLSYATSHSPDTIDITTASLDDPSIFPPAAEVWLADKVAWQPTSAETSKFPGSSSG
ncbi:MAG TPA: GFA family protein [Steroidobacteraceae bacterium]|nr:GFA family protein [Steroidobacteraceae bacterium]